MASLSANANLGNTSVSSLIKSAATLTNELATFNDDEARITYENSAKTSDDLTTYVNYLNSRITTLQGTGTLSDQTKALTMSQTIVTATHANISADISRENIALMSGGDAGTVAGYQAKMGVIGNEYSRALAIGDDALAQTLESQYYSTSQTMQAAQQTAATAASTLGSSGASSENGVATNLEDNLEALNADIKVGGMAKLNSTVAAWVKTNSAQLEALGVKLPAGAQPSYQDIVMGVTNAEIQAHTLAANAMAPYDPNSAQSYYDEAQKIANGDTTVQTLAGSLTAEQIQNWTQNPAMFAPKEDVVDGRLQFTYTSPTANQNGASNISGLKYQNGQVVANYTGSDFAQNLNAKQVTQVNTTLQKLGVSFQKVTTSTSTQNGIAVQLTNQTANFLKKLTGGQTGVGTRVYLQPNGNLQVGTIDNSGNSHIYTITTDSKGLQGAYEQTPDGKSVAVGGQYGFNEKNNGVVGNQTVNGKQVDGTSPSGMPINRNSDVAQFGDQKTINGLVNAKVNGKSMVGRVIGSGDGKAAGIGNNGLLNQLIDQAQIQLKVTTEAQQAALTQPAQSTQLTAPALKAAAAPVQPVAVKYSTPTVQSTATPQPASPQSTQILQPTTNPQGTSGGASINQSGSGGIKLGSSSGPTIKL